MDDLGIYIDNRTDRSHHRKLLVGAHDHLMETEPKNRSWPFLGSLCERSFGKTFRTIMRRAGIQRGCFKWLRRLSGCYAGALSHADTKTFEHNYRDSSIMPDELIEPRTTWIWLSRLSEVNPNLTKTQADGET